MDINNKTYSPETLESQSLNGQKVDKLNKTFTPPN
jgi:hypothetical protein